MVAPPQTPPETPPETPCGTSGETSDGFALELADVAATEALAAEMAASLEAGDVVALTGDLGAGKSVFSRALIRAAGRVAGLGIGHVPSPTFTLVQLYDLPEFTIYHFDLYRLSAAEEAIEIGIEDAFADGVSVIEWAERIEDMLPSGTIRVRIDFGTAETGRIARISGWTRTSGTGTAGTGTSGTEA